MRHKVVAHKVRRITIISYSSIIQIKLHIFRQQNDRKNSAISSFNFQKINKAKQHYCKSTVYTMSSVPHQKLKALMI